MSLIVAASHADSLDIVIAGKKREGKYGYSAKSGYAESAT